MARKNVGSILEDSSEVNSTEVNELVDLAASLNVKMTADKKVLDGYKSQLKSMGIDEIAGKEYKAVITERTKTSFIADKAVEIAKSIGAEWLLKTTIDEDKLTDALMTGEIDSSVFLDAIKESTSKAITFRKVK